MSLTVGTDWRPSVLVVGHGAVAARFNDLFRDKDAKLFVEMDPTVDAGNLSDIAYGRDLRICRLDGSLLIPYGFSDAKSGSFGRRFRAMLPATSPQVMDVFDPGYGKGCIRDNVGVSARLAVKQRISFLQGKSVIEGGNCFLFRGEGGRAKGIVGVHSPILTLIALEEQGYYDVPEVRSKLAEIQARCDAPSEECLRMARNLSYYAQHQGLHNELDQIGSELMCPRKEESVEENFRRLNLDMKRRVIREILDAYDDETGYRALFSRLFQTSIEASLEFKQKGIELEPNWTWSGR